MSRWFRFYDMALDDPKVQRLPCEQFKAWINLLCLAARNNGRLPDLPDVSFALRMGEGEVHRIIGQLEAAGLLDATEDGYSPHNWHGRQFSSDNDDTVAERKRRQRDKEAAEKAALAMSQHVTRDMSQDVTRTEQNRTDSEKNIGRDAPDHDFDDFKKGYPKRVGANPWAPARKAYVAARKGGAAAGVINAGARRYAEEIRKAGTQGQFVAQAVTWINQRRWEDYESNVVALAIPPPEGFFVGKDTPEESAWKRKLGLAMPAATRRLNGQDGRYMKTLYPADEEESA